MDKYMDKYTKILVAVTCTVDFFKATSATFYVSSTSNFYLYGFKSSLFTKPLHNIIFFLFLAFITASLPVHELVFNSNSLINAMYKYCAV